jgi:hypothetical protein
MQMQHDINYALNFDLSPGMAMACNGQDKIPTVKGAGVAEDDLCRGLSFLNLSRWSVLHSVERIGAQASNRRGG